MYHFKLSRSEGQLMCFESLHSSQLGAEIQ